MIRHLTPVLLTLALCACGWQLRGQDPATDLSQLSGVYLQASGDNSVASALERQLQFRQVSVLNSMQPDSLGLVLAPPRIESRVQTLSGDLRASQIRLQMELTFQLLDAQGEELANQSLVVVRSFTQNPLEPASVERQRSLLEAEMADQLAVDLLNLMSRYLPGGREN